MSEKSTYQFKKGLSFHADTPNFLQLLKQQTQPKEIEKPDREDRDDEMPSIELGANVSKSEVNDFFKGHESLHKLHKDELEEPRDTSSSGPVWKSRKQIQDLSSKNNKKTKSNSSSGGVTKKSKATAKASKNLLSFDEEAE